MQAFYDLYLIVRSKLFCFPHSKWYRYISATSRYVLGALRIKPGVAVWEARALPLCYPFQSFAFTGVYKTSTATTNEWRERELCTLMVTLLVVSTSDILDCWHPRLRNLSFDKWTLPRKGAQVLDHQSIASKTTSQENSFDFLFEVEMCFTLACVLTILERIFTVV